MHIQIDDILYKSAAPKIKAVPDTHGDITLVEVSFNGQSLLITDVSKVTHINGEAHRIENLAELADTLNASETKEFIYKTFIF